MRTHSLATAATAIACRIAVTLVASALIAGLLLAWQIRPALPPLPRSLTARVTGNEIEAAVQFAAWGAFILLDLSLLAEILARAGRRRPGTAERRLHAAFASRRHQSAAVEPRGWRAFARPLEPIFFGYSGTHEAAAAAIAALPQLTPNEVTGTNYEEETSATGGGRVGVHLLGRFELTGSGVEQPRRKATAELIAYLALKKNGASREELLEALWPAEDPGRSEQRFWQASTEARRLLRGGLRRKRNRYLLDRKHVSVDLDELHRLVDEAERASVGNEQRMVLERALALIRDRPLVDIDTLWAEGEARRLRALQIELLNELGRRRLAGGEAAAALEAAEQGLAIDTSSEPLTRLAMEAEAALGLRDAVVTRYQALQQTLQERLGLEPARETRLTYRRLLSQDPG